MNNPTTWSELHRFEYGGEKMSVDVEWPPEGDENKYRICLLNETTEGEPLNVTTLLTAYIKVLQPLALADWLTKSFEYLDTNLSSLALQVK